VPVEEAVDGEGEVLAGELPAGRYAEATYVGHPDQLIAFTGAFLEEAANRGLTWDVTETEHGTHWGRRLEVLLTKQAEQPDPDKWETKLSFRLA
jgi:hypothetical protein